MKLRDIITTVAGEVKTPLTNEDISVHSITSLEGAAKDSVTFITKNSYIKEAEACDAIAIFTRDGWEVSGKINIIVADPYVAYAITAQLFEQKEPLFGTKIDSTAVIDERATIGKNVSVGPKTVIGAGVTIGADSKIDASVIIEKDSVLGAKCHIHSGAVIRYGSKIGDEVIVASGAVIGSEGFANAFTQGQFIRIPCFGTVVLEDRVEIGANTTIDRGNFEDTIIRAGTRIDNLVQVAHNVEIGESCGIAAQAGFAGSTKVGNYVMIGGQAGFAGHITIGDGAFIGAQAGIPGNVAPQAKITGSPAIDLRKRRRIDAAEQKLPQALRDLKQLQKEIEELKTVLEKKC